MERTVHFGDIAEGDKQEWKEWLELNPRFKANVEARHATLQADIKQQRAARRADNWEKDFPTLG
jgi:hypothetical protein